MLTLIGFVYGRLFSARGVAGLTAPLIAGYLFDVTGIYTLALAVAAGAAAPGLVFLWTIPLPPESPEAPAR